MKKRNKLKTIGSKRQSKATTEQQLKTRPGQSLEPDITRIQKDMERNPTDTHAHQSLFEADAPGCVFSDTDPSGTTCSVEGIENLKPGPHVAPTLKDGLREQMHMILDPKKK